MHRLNKKRRATRETALAEKVRHALRRTKFVSPKREYHCRTRVPIRHRLQYFFVATVHEGGRREWIPPRRGSRRWKLHRYIRRQWHSPR